jgi:hypothetical protein
MPLKTITVTISEDGTFKTDYSRFTGTDCLEAGKKLHALLSEYGVQIDPTSITPKPELLEVLDEQGLAGLETNREVEMGG